MFAAIMTRSPTSTSPSRFRSDRGSTPLVILLPKLPETMIRSEMSVLQSPLTSSPCCRGGSTLIARVVEFVDDPEAAVTVMNDDVVGVSERVETFRVLRQTLLQENEAGLKTHDILEGTKEHDRLMEAFDIDPPKICLSVIVAYAEPPCTTDMSPELERESWNDDVKNSSIGVAFESLVVSGGRFQRVSMVASAE